MHLLPAQGIGILLLTNLASGTKIDTRQSQTAQYCAADGVCYSQYTAPASNITYRIAIPDVSNAPFDVLLQIDAPSAVGWAGIAWGGVMANNPLTVVWPNGNTAIVSSRWATGHTLPGAYSGATYTVLRTSKDSASWGIDLLCTGCSSWDGASLNSNGTNSFAWAMSSRPATNPASNTSGFPAHTAKSKFDHDLAVAKLPIAKFSALVQSLSASTASTGSASTSISAPTTSALSTGLSQIIPGSSSTLATTLQSVSIPTISVSSTPSVLTGVTTLPKPSRSLSSLSSNTIVPIVTTGVTVLPQPTAKSSSSAVVTVPILSTSIPSTSKTFSFDPPIPTSTFSISRIPDSPWTQTVPTAKPSTVVTAAPTATVARSSSLPLSPVRPSPIWPTPPRGRPPPGRGPPWRHHPP